MALPKVRIGEAIEFLDERFDSTLTAEFSQETCCKLLWLMCRQRPDTKVNHYRVKNYEDLYSKLSGASARARSRYDNYAEMLENILRDPTSSHIDELARAQNFQEKWLEKNTSAEATNAQQLTLPQFFANANTLTIGASQWTLQATGALPGGSVMEGTSPQNVLVLSPQLHPPQQPPTPVQHVQQASGAALIGTVVQSTSASSGPPHRDVSAGGSIGPTAREPPSKVLALIPLSNGSQHQEAQLERKPQQDPVELGAGAVPTQLQETADRRTEQGNTSEAWNSATNEQVLRSSGTPPVQGLGQREEDASEMRNEPRLSEEEIGSVTGPAAGSEFSEGNLCVICQDSLGTEPVEALLCSHVFHTTCLDKYCSATGRDRTLACPMKCHRARSDQDIEARAEEAGVAVDERVPQPSTPIGLDASDLQAEIARVEAEASELVSSA